MAEAQRHSERQGDGFLGPIGHSAKLEAWRFFCGAHGASASPPSVHRPISQVDFKELVYW